MEQEFEIIKREKERLVGILDGAMNHCRQMAGQLDETAQVKLGVEDVMAADALTEQRIRLTARIHAIDDTVEMLGKALSRGLVEVAVYLKIIRQLSKEQYLAKVTLSLAVSSIDQ